MKRIQAFVSSTTPLISTTASNSDSSSSRNDGMMGFRRHYLLQRKHGNNNEQRRQQQLMMIIMTNFHESNPLLHVPSLSILNVPSIILGSDFGKKLVKKMYTVSYRKNWIFLLKLKNSRHFFISHSINIHTCTCTAWYSILF